MLRLLAGLVIAMAVFLVATAFSGTAKYTTPSHVTTRSGPERGSLRLVP